VKQSAKWEEETQSQRRHVMILGDHEKVKGKKGHKMETMF
jgi:hypothetical protein